MKNFKTILSEELQKFSEQIKVSEKGLKKIHLNESYSLIANLEDLKENLYDEKNHIPLEHWDFFKKTLTDLNKNENFQEFSKLIMCKLYALKFNSKVNFTLNNNLDEEIRFELKDYLSQLRVDTLEDFLEVLVNLPFEFVALVCRYNANILNKANKNNLCPQLKTAQKYLKQNQETKNKFIININRLSRGEASTLSLEDLKELLETRAFYEDNPINAATIEYIIRLFNFEASKTKLEEMFDKHLLARMKEQALYLPSYINFLSNIAEEKDQPYFTQGGLQDKNKDVTYNDLITKYLMPQLYVPKTPASTDPNKPEIIEPTQGELMGNNSNEDILPQDEGAPEEPPQKLEKPI